MMSKGTSSPPKEVHNFVTSKNPFPKYNGQKPEHRSSKPEMYLFNCEYV